MRRNVLIAAAICWLMPGVATAHDGEDTGVPATPSGSAADGTIQTPPTYKGNDVKVDEHLGAKVPLDAKFQTSDGVAVTLGDLIGKSDVPVILTFNYSDCPMLCSVQLNGLTAALAPLADPIGVHLGAQFRIITIDLEPSEGPDKLSQMKARYLERVPEADRARAKDGWTFLAAATKGDDASIRRVADAVGFHYTYLKDQAQWAHPAALIFVSAGGAVTRYVYGIEFDPKIMKDSIYKAGVAEPASAVGFMLRCYHFDPDANSHTHGAIVALRVAAASSVFVLLAIFGVMQIIKRSKRSGAIR